MVINTTDNKSEPNHGVYKTTGRDDFNITRVSVKIERCMFQSIHTSHSDLVTLPSTFEALIIYFPSS